MMLRIAFSLAGGSCRQSSLQDTHSEHEIRDSI